jgi:hypothetical protein
MIEVMSLLEMRLDISLRANHIVRIAIKRSRKAALLSTGIISPDDVPEPLLLLLPDIPSYHLH